MPAIHRFSTVDGMQFKKVTSGEKYFCLIYQNTLQHMHFEDFKIKKYLRKSKAETKGMALSRLAGKDKKRFHLKICAPIGYLWKYQAIS